MECCRMDSKWVKYDDFADVVDENRLLKKQNLQFKELLFKVENYLDSCDDMEAVALRSDMYNTIRAMGTVNYEL